MIEPSLNPLVAAMRGAMPDLEVEVELPDSETQMTEDGGALVSFGDASSLLREVAFGDNLAEVLGESELTTLSSDLIAEFESDKTSRKDWEDTYMKGLDLLGLTFEERDEPWDGACGVFHPLLAESVIRFQAQTIQEIFPASGPVKTTVVGNKSPERIKQAERVKEYLNFLCTKEMTEYRNETEQLLFSLPLAGAAFRKVYFDPTLGRPVASFVPAEDYVVSYSTTDLATCERGTHIMKRSVNWVRKMQVKGFYRDIELAEPSPDISEIARKMDKITGESQPVDLDNRHILLEMGVDLDLPGFEDEKDGKLTGVALPYIVTIDKSSTEVLAIRRNWAESDQAKLKREHFIHYQYLPGLGFYGFGLVHMIGGLAKSATSLLRQLVDAGTLANLPGGLKTRGLRIKGDDTPIKPGEFRDVDVPQGAIRDNIAFMPYKEPSMVLYQLLKDIVEEGRRFASAADLKAADMNGEAPVGTTLAILEKEMKVMSAVQARIHASMGKELILLGGLVKSNGPEDYPYEIEGEFTIREDFDDRIDVIPVSDPNSGTMSQRIMQYQAALQLASQAPQMYDMPFLHRQMLLVLGINDVEKVIPIDDDMKPADPVSENVNIIIGEPVKAFLYQDHEAHIQTHVAASKHPKLIEMMQMNPNATVVQAAMAAHIAEHVSMLYRQQIEKELGVHLPDPEMPLPEDIELRLSRLVAPAADQLTGKAEKQAQAEKNAKEQEDPMLQMAKKELEIKEQDSQTKAQAGIQERLLKLKKSEDDMKEKEAKISIEWAKLHMKEKELGLKGDLASAEMDLKEDQHKTKADHEEFNTGLEIADRIYDRAIAEQDRLDELRQQQQDSGDDE